MLHISDQTTKQIKYPIYLELDKIDNPCVLTSLQVEGGKGLTKSSYYPTKKCDKDCIYMSGFYNTSGGALNRLLIKPHTKLFQRIPNNPKING